MTDETKAARMRELDEAEVERLRARRDYLRLLLGPLPLSIAIHVSLLILLIMTIHNPTRDQGRELIVVNVQPGGGGGGGDTGEMQRLKLPDVPMPDTAAAPIAMPAAIDRLPAVEVASDYVRAAGSGVGIGRGGGIGRAMDAVSGPALADSLGGCVKRAWTWCWSSTAPAR